MGILGRLNCFKSEERLRKDLLGCVGAENLIDVANFDLACGRGLRRSAVLDLLAAGFGLACFIQVSGDFVAQAIVEKLLAELRECLWVGRGELRVPADLVGDLDSVAEGRCVHQL